MQQRASLQNVLGEFGRALPTREEEARLLALEDTIARTIPKTAADVRAKMALIRDYFDLAADGVITPDQSTLFLAASESAQLITPTA